MKNQKIIDLEKVKISFRPKEKHLNEIAEWKIDNSNLSMINSGNWFCISKSYKEKGLVIATYKNKTIGFYTFSIYNFCASIGVAQVDLEFRKKGVARLLLDAIIKKYENEIYALSLFCSPKSSQKIWKKLGFEHYPKALVNDKTDGRVDMYRIIRPYLKPSKISRNSKKEKEIIEIWNDEPYISERKNIEPNYVWNLKFIKKTRILEKPIIYFGNSDWRIRWRKGDKVFRDCKFKYFDKKYRGYAHIIIEELPPIE